MICWLVQKEISKYLFPYLSVVKHTANIYNISWKLWFASLYVFFTTKKNPLYSSFVMVIIWTNTIICDSHAIMWLPWYWMQSHFDIWLTAQMAFGLLFPAEFEVIEVLLNSSEGNQAENTHLKWKGQRKKMYKLENNGGRKKCKCEIIYKIAKLSIDFLSDYQLQICLASELSQVNNFYSLNKMFPGEDSILVWNQVVPQPQ